MSALTEQKCPNCGGAVEFDASSQNLKCPYCDTEFEIDASEPTEEENAAQGEDSFSWEAADTTQWADGESDGMAVYCCKSCGGEIVAEETTGATTCPYCDNPVVMEGKFSGQLRPDLVIPFRYDKKAAKETLNRYIASKKLVPAIFRDQKHIDEIRGIYVPHWLFSGTAVADACFNAQRTVSWSDSNYRYTQTDYFSCTRSGTMNFSNVPVDGSSKMDDALMESIEPFDVSQAVDYNKAYLAGFFADKYDVDPDASIPRANERVKESVVSGLEGTVNAGYTLVTRSGAHLDIADGFYRYALYPVWLLNTTWNGKKYTFAMNGQTGKFVGDLPLDKRAFWKKVAMLTAPLGAVAYAVMWIAGLM